MKKQKKIFLFLEIVFIVSLPLSISGPYLLILQKYCSYSAGFDLAFALLYLLRIAALIHVLKIILMHFYRNVVKSKTEIQNVNRKLVMTTLAFCFFTGEIIFSFVPQNQGNTTSGLAQSVWYMYYFHPVNEYGYRDKKVDGRMNSTKRKIFFLGDSFTAGHGVKHFEDCYSSIVSKRIDENKFEVFNLGRSGSDTKDELLRLKEFKITPDILFLQYYHNDIEPVAKGYGHFNSREVSLGKKIIYLSGITIARTSFFLNFLIVNAASGMISNFISTGYRDEIKGAFDDQQCLNEHLKDLDSLIMHCKENNIKLYFIFIPDLTDVDFTERVCFGRIKPFLIENSIPFISLQEDLRKYKASELTVGPLDNHANEFTQKIIAEKILRSVQEFNKDQ